MRTILIRTFQFLIVILAMTYAARYLNPGCSPTDTGPYCGRSGLLSLIPDIYTPKPTEPATP